MSIEALDKAKHIASAVVNDLAGYGLYGVELFVKGDDVYFSEVSPRPHDTGLVTLGSQNLSEFALHARAILGFPIGEIKQYGPWASSVVLAEGHSDSIAFSGVELALAQPNTQLRLFGKPEIHGRRRLGVAISAAETIEQAIEYAQRASRSVKTQLD
jgi:phosphoribosylglycinamide formyltransferase 2